MSSSVDLDRSAASAISPSLSVSASARQQVSAMRARDARGRKTMALVHAALIDLVEEQPFERITVDDIIRRAGVGRSTFYRHYADKDALLEEVANAEITHFAALAIPIMDTTDSLPECRRVVAHVGEHRKLWNVLLTGSAAGVMRQKMFELSVPEPNSPRGIVADGDVPVDLSIRWGVAAAVEVLSWWVKNPERATVEQVAGYLNRLAVRPALDMPRNR